MLLSVLTTDPPLKYRYLLNTETLNYTSQKGAQMKWSLTASIFLSILLAAGCGGEAADGADENSDRVEVITDPEALGNRVADIYEEMYADLNGLVSQGLSAEEVWPELTAMKEDYISQFVELGAVREGMTEGQKQTINLTINSRFYNLDMDVFNSVNDAIIFYRDQDNSLSNEISQMNILTQYSDYELLRQQEPEEAARLGIQ